MRRFVLVFLCVCFMHLIFSLFLLPSARADIPRQSMRFSFYDQLHSRFLPPDDPRCMWTRIRWFNPNDESRIIGVWETPEEDGSFCEVYFLKDKNNNKSIEVCAYPSGRAFCHFLRFMYIRLHPENPYDLSGSWRRVYSVYIYREDFDGVATEKRMVPGDGFFELRYAPSLDYFPDQELKDGIQQALTQPLLVSPP